MAEAIRTKGRPATYADLEAVPANLVAEIVYGNLVTHPRPAPRHAAASSALGGELTGPFQKGAGGPGGWVFMVEPELQLGANIVVPDIAGWRMEHLPSLPETNWIDTPPDWVCGVLSPSTERLDRGEKRQIYAEAGVPHLWLVDPRAQILEAFELAAGKWLLAATFLSGVDVVAPPFEVHRFALSLLWPFDPPAENRNE